MKVGVDSVHMKKKIDREGLINIENWATLFLSDIRIIQSRVMKY